jgi:hypothetical protein
MGFNLACKGLIHAAIPNSHNLHSITTERLHKYTDMKEELIRMQQLKMAYLIPLALSTMVLSQTNYMKV